MSRELSAAPAGRWRRHLPFLAIAAAYLALGLGYSLATPVGEGPDEPGHLAYVRHLQRERSLPVLGEVDEPLAQQVKHPPLYYAALALLTAGGGYEGLTWFPNPHCCNLERPSPAVIRHDEGDRFPYAPGYRSARLARLWTLLAGLVAVWATYAAAGVAFPRRGELALAASASLAFLPQFLFMQGVVNNDGLANALGALALLAALRVALDGAARRDLVFLGLAVGLGLITKLTMLAWLAVAALAVGVAALRARRLGLLGRGLLWCGLPLAAACGWWFAWNLATKGDLLGWGRWLGSTGELRRKLPLGEQLADYAAIQWQSLWGSFGWVTVRMPDPVYRLVGGISLLALSGLALATGRWLRASRAGRAEARSAWAVLLIAAAAALVYASVFRLAFAFDLTVAQGRYLFTGLAALAILFSLGLLSLVPDRLARRAAGALAGGMLLLALYGLFGVLWPTFRTPPRLAAAELAALPNRLEAEIGPAARLLGYALPPGGGRPGAALPVSLVWDTPRRIDEGDFVFVHVVDALGRVVGRVDALPGGGRYPTVLWYPNWPWRDTVTVPIAPWAAPGKAEVLVGLYPLEQPEARLPVRQDGRELGDHLTLGPVLIRPEAPPPLPPTATVRADLLSTGDAPGGRDLARLAGYHIGPAAGDPGPAAGAALEVTLYWEALGPLPADYTVFVHALGPDGEQLAGGDGPPAAGRWPSSLWAAGDRIADRHRLRLPPGLDPATLGWSVGLYEPTGGQRLPARDAEGRPWPDAAIRLAP